MTKLKIEAISLVAFFIIFVGVSAITNCRDFNENKSDKIQLILFYMPWSVENGESYLTIYWNNPFFRSGDIIKLYFESNETEPIVEMTNFLPMTNKGFKRIAIRNFKFVHDDNYFVNHHLNFHGAWLTDGKIVKWDVLSTHISWMSERKHLLSNRKLPELFIPGSHQSGSYQEHFVSQSIPAKYVVTQGTNVLDQLVAGVRYLHLTPANSYMSYWINHGEIQMNPLQDIIDDIKTFMNGTEEIVIVDFHEFLTGFYTDEDHENFINYLERQLEGFYLPRKNDSSNEWWSYTLNDIWKSGKRLIISYNHPLQSQKLSLWRPCQHKWGNAPDINTLDNFLGSFEVVSHDRLPLINEPKVSRAHVTLTTIWSVMQAEADSSQQVEHPSLHDLSMEAGMKATQWYNEDFFGSANVVAVNFVQATGIVPIAIEWNERRTSDCYESYFNLMRSEHSYPKD